MVIDSSAVFAIVLDEPESALFSGLLLRQPKPLISAGTLVELAAVGTRRFAGRYDARIEYVLASVGPEIRPITVAQAGLAREAYRTYGLGTGHKAHLNFGDCLAYALAKETGEPLLFKGDDFTQTDIGVAIPR